MQQGNFGAGFASPPQQGVPFGAKSIRSRCRCNECHAANGTSQPIRSKWRIHSTSTTRGYCAASTAWRPRQQPATKWSTRRTTNCGGSYVHSGFGSLYVPPRWAKKRCKLDVHFFLLFTYYTSEYLFCIFKQVNMFSACFRIVCVFNFQ